MVTVYTYWSRSPNASTVTCEGAGSIPGHANPTVSGEPIHCTNPLYKRERDALAPDWLSHRQPLHVIVIFFTSALFPWSPSSYLLLASTVIAALFFTLHDRCLSVPRTGLRASTYEDCGEEESSVRASIASPIPRTGLRASTDEDGEV